MIPSLLKRALKMIIPRRFWPVLARLRRFRSPAAHQALQLVHEGNQYLTSGNHRRALKSYLAACKKDRDTRWISGRSLLDYVTEKQLDTESHFDLLRSVWTDPDYVVPHLEKALVLRAFQGDPDRLEKEFEKIPARRLSYEPLEALGSEALGIGRNKLALKAYRQALDRQPNNLSLIEQIGVTEFLTGLYPEAEETFARADHQKRLERERLGVDKSPYVVLDRTWLLAIGHVAFLDTYIKGCKLGWTSQKKSLLVYDGHKPPAGFPLFQFFSKHLEIVGTEKPIHEKIDDILSADVVSADDDVIRERQRISLSRSFWCGPDGGGRIRWYGPWGAAVERAWKQQGNPALFGLSDEERKLFRRRMAETFGLPEDVWFVLLHVREPGFHAQWHTHHAGTRNAEIAAYNDVIDFVLSKGGWVVRGGDSSMSPLPPRERVVDYATSAQKHPEIDIYLCAECAYFVGTNSGFSVVPPVFGRRCGLTNWSPIAIPNWYPDDIYVPKLVRKVSEDRHLSFKEMYASFAGWSQFARDFRNSDFVIEDNSPEDLRELTEELHDEVFGTAPAPGPEDQELLRRFNEIVTANGGYVGSRMGYRFLRKYQHLLD